MFTVIFSILFTAAYVVLTVKRLQNEISRTNKECGYKTQLKETKNRPTSDEYNINTNAAIGVAVGIAALIGLLKVLADDDKNYKNNFSRSYASVGILFILFLFDH